MSTETITTILIRAVREPEYRTLLFRDAGQALADYELTDAERTLLTGLTPDNFDVLAHELDQRFSLSIVWGDGPKPNTGG